MSKADVMKKANWSSPPFMYKISLAKLMYKIYNNLTPDAMSAMIKSNDNIKRYQLRKNLKIDVRSFNANYMRNSSTSFPGSLFSASIVREERPWERGWELCSL